MEKESPSQSPLPIAPSPDSMHYGCAGSRVRERVHACCQTLRAVGFLDLANNRLNFHHPIAAFHKTQCRHDVSGTNKMFTAVSVDIYVLLAGMRPSRGYPTKPGN